MELLMGRNFYSVCNKCRVYTMHYRGQEGRNLHRFADDHNRHKEYTEVLDDYAKEPEEGYKDVFDKYHDKPTTKN